jgi:hypothetical protein
MSALPILSHPADACLSFPFCLIRPMRVCPSHSVSPGRCMSVLPILSHQVDAYLSFPFYLTRSMHVCPSHSVSLGRRVASSQGQTDCMAGARRAAFVPKPSVLVYRILLFGAARVVCSRLTRPRWIRVRVIWLISDDKDPSPGKLTRPSPAGTRDRLLLSRMAVQSSLMAGSSSLMCVAADGGLADQ